MPDREAACGCGQVRIVCAGDPVRISMCHCLECQRRTGSVFGVQAWFPPEQVRRKEGASKRFARTADSGRIVTFSFCPGCGGTVYWEAEQRPGWVAVAVGCFADPDFAPPGHSVWERRRHRWTAALGGLPMDHSD
jgi:hypothetical protein